MPDHDTHALSFTDIPHVIRLAGDGVLLDSRLQFTDGGASGGWLTSMMPHTSRHTLVARYEGRRVVGQFDILPHSAHARIVYMAPQLPDGEPDDAWLLLLDAMVREAGRRRAHTLAAEIHEMSPLFPTMRHSGFAVYARQHVWGAHARDLPEPPLLELHPVEAEGNAHIGLFAGRTIPSLLQQVTPPPTEPGYAYYEGGQMMAFVSVAEGRDGVYLMPYMDHRMACNPADVLLAVAGQLSQLDRRPIAVRVRRHQGWMNSALEMAGFELITQQALMVRHIAAGIHSPGFAPLSRKLAKGALPRRTEKVPEVCIDADWVPQAKAMTLENWTMIGSRVPCDGMTRNAPQRHPVCPNGGVPG